MSRSVRIVSAINQITGEDSTPAIQGRRKWYRAPLCWIGVCLHKPFFDEGGCGGQCISCGKICGYVTRAQLRGFADAEFAKSDPAQPHGNAS